ncbi:DUF5667 domain-containing protein [Clostridium sp. HMP27]|uniref:DUF5667 domain-containing protein n=1 Tax=Clostridium sp. HMP27 TaxID=1487921 RepID=UPI00052DA878|nr:DUF5667 domain-containing protein [Clostridium sp. HMP27]KGK89543.1 hypothetical protein DP68_03515 [Clostridium sp. HMP27]
MKKKLLLSLTMFAALTFSTSVFAAEEVTLKEEAGITPDSILYPIDTSLESLEVKFSLSDGARIEELAAQAQERLGESEIMFEDGNTKLASEALGAYNDKMGEAAEALETVLETTEAEIKEDFENSEAVIQESGEVTVPEEPKELEELEQLEEIVQGAQTESLEVLENLEDEAGEDAQEVISDVVEMQITKREAVKAMVAQRHKLNASRKAMNKAKVALIKAQKSGDETAIAAAQTALEESKAIYETDKVTMVEVFDKKQAAVKSQPKEVVDGSEEAAEGTDGSTGEQDKVDEVTDEEKAELDKQVEEAEGSAVKASITKAAEQQIQSQVTSTKEVKKVKEPVNKVKEVKVKASENKKANVNIEEKKQDKPNSSQEKKEEKSKPETIQSQVVEKEAVSEDTSTNKGNEKNKNSEKSEKGKSKGKDK